MSHPLLPAVMENAKTSVHCWRDIMHREVSNENTKI